MNKIVVTYSGAELKEGTSPEESDESTARPPRPTRCMRSSCDMQRSTWIQESCRKFPSVSAMLISVLMHWMCLGRISRVLLSTVNFASEDTNALRSVSM